MSKLGLINSLAVAVALAVSMALGIASVDPPLAPISGAPPAGQVLDATGSPTPVAAYQRIVSASPVADGVLLELVEPARVAAFTAFSAENSPRKHLFSGRPTLGQLDDLEALLAMGPDLIVVNNFADPRKVARMREAGLRVFDLGPMTGVASFVEDAQMLASVLGLSERGAALTKTFEQRLSRVAAHIPAAHRRSGIYLTVYGTKLFGGAAGTSYHDILRFGGLDDAATATGHTSWPQYREDTLLQLDPEVIVTQASTASAVCRHPWVANVRACKPGGLVIAVPDALLGDAGLGMLDAAEAVYEAAYGP